MQNPQNKKRKGISVSLTPHKNEHVIIKTKYNTPRISTIQLKQSHVNAEQYMKPVKDQTLRSRSSVPQHTSIPQRASVVFRYDNIPKQNQQHHQTQRLNHEIYNLQKQIIEKRHVVNQIRNQSLVNTQKPKYYTRGQKIKTSAKINQMPSQQRQESRVKKVVYGHQIKQIKQQKRQISPKKELISPKKGQIQPKKEKNKNKGQVIDQKENSKLNQGKLTKLKWAQQKLIQIIKVCDEGL